MADSPGRNESSAQPAFSFGDMALSEEVDRGFTPAQQPAHLLEPLDDDANLNEAIEALRMIVLNEQFSPDILKYQQQAVDGIRGLVSQQTSLVDEEEDESTDRSSLSVQLKRMELDRVNYLLRHYLRLRLKKVEKFIMHIFKDSDAFDLLSDAEQRFATGYSDLIENHFKQSFLSMLPPRLQIIEKDGNVDHATPPVLDEFVFCRVRNTVGRFAIGEEAADDALDLTKGDILCVRYKSIRELLNSEDVELI